MNSTTKNTIEIASALGRRGFTVASVEVHTPDRRTWNVLPESSGGFRLFEIDRDQDTNEEHDAVDGETWHAGDLLDYLAAVGAAKKTND